jgi:hypothetical protein
MRRILPSAQTASESHSMRLRDRDVVKEWRSLSAVMNVDHGQIIW